jgi:hypothetical protein
MKRLLSLLLGLMLLAMFGSQPALASCAMPSTQEQIARATAIVYGNVTQGDRGTREIYYTVELKQIYKGSPKNPAFVADTTSLEVYKLAVGTDHTLYLRLNEKGLYETDLCAGSHPGPPTANELNLLGAGAPAGAPTFTSAWRIWIPVIAMVATFSVVGFIIVIRKRDD